MKSADRKVHSSFEEVFDDDTFHDCTSLSTTATPIATMDDKTAISPVKETSTAAKVSSGASFAHTEARESLAFGPQKPSWKHRVKRHYRRFWCCYALLAVILLAILLPIL